MSTAQALQNGCLDVPCLPCRPSYYLLFRDLDRLDVDGARLAGRLPGRALSAMPFFSSTYTGPTSTAHAL